MCAPAVAPLIGALSNPAVMMGMAGAQWYQGEQTAKAGRQSARHALSVTDQNLLTRETNEKQAAMVERDKIRRQGAMARGAMLAGGVGRGLATSAALNAINQEYYSREDEMLQAVGNQRDMQAQSWAIERGAAGAAYGNRMAANKGTGILGLGLALGEAALQSQMALGQSPAQAQRVGYQLGRLGPKGLMNASLPGINMAVGSVPGLNFPGFNFAQ